MAFYSNVGYGKLSDHTMPDALAVALAEKAMRVRPVEDQIYYASEEFRKNYWGG